MVEIRPEHLDIRLPEASEGLHHSNGKLHAVHGQTTGLPPQLTI